MARRIKRQGEAGLIITSLIDVFVIVLVFLMQSVSSEGSLMTSAENLVLPMSQRSKSPTEVSLTIIGDQEHITVDNIVMANTVDVRKQDSLIVAKVYTVLIQKRDEERKAELLGIIKEATGKVVVQFDKNTPYDIVTKVMATCGYAGYNNIKFAVTKKNEEG